MFIDELLLKNHDLRSADTETIPETNANLSTRSGYSKGMSGGTGMVPVVVAVKPTKMIITFGKELPLFQIMIKARSLS